MNRLKKVWFKLSPLVILVLVFFGFWTSVAKAQVVHSDPVDHYSFSLPSGWEEIPKDVIEQFVDLVVRQTQGKRIEYDAGFQLESKEYFQYPYVLVQEYEIDSPSYSEIERELNSGSFTSGVDDAAEQYSELLRNATIEDPFVDKERAVILSTADSEISNVGTVKALVAIFLGKQHTTRLFFYALEDEYIEQLPVFMSIVDSFSYEQDYAYDPITAEENDSSSIFEGIIEKGFIGLIVGAIFGFFIMLFRRGQKNIKDK